MPNPKLETYKNKATGDVYDYTDADAQSKLTAILDGTTIDSFGDVESALADKADKVTSATNGNFAGLDSNGNLTDSGKKSSDFATAASVTAIEGKIPSGASSSNKMATASDVAAKISWADAGKSVKKNYAQITIASGKVDHNITFTVANDKKISTSGTTNSDNRTDVGVAYLEAGTYIFSGNPANSGLRIRLFNSDDSHIFWNEPGEENTITIPTSEKYTIGLRYGNNENLSGKVFAIMIRLASILDNTYAENIPDNTELMTWEANAKTGVHNFLLPELVVVDAANGISYASDKGVYTLTGTASANSYGHIDYGVLPAGKYKFSGVSGGSASGNKYYMDLNLGDTRLARLFDGEAEVTLDGTSFVRGWLNVVSGYAIPTGGIQFKPMLTLPDDTLEDFTEGVMTNKMLTDMAAKIVARENVAENTSYTYAGKSGTYLVITSHPYNNMGSMYLVDLFGAAGKVTDIKSNVNVTVTQSNNVITVALTQGAWVKIIDLGYYH